MTDNVEIEKRGIFQELFKLGGPKGQAIDYSARQVVYEAGDPARWFYLIESGEVRLFHANGHSTTRLLDILGTGDWLGSAARETISVCLTELRHQNMVLTGATS